MKRLFTSLVVLGVASAGAQESGSISGRVLDREIRRPLAYTNIVLFSTNDSSPVTGTVT